MTGEEFQKQLDIASAQVETWPLWKQNMLRDSLSPTVPVPRTPIDNFRTPKTTGETLMAFPTDRKPTLDEAALVLIEAGWEIARPGSGGIPKKWADIVNTGVRLLLVMLASYTAGDLATRPNAATKEQVTDAVKEQTPAIAAEVKAAK